MPAERKKSASMEEKETPLSNKEKEFGERRSVSSRDRPKEDVRLGMKREMLKPSEDKKKKMEEEKRKKDEKEWKKKEDEKIKSEEEQKRKEEEEKQKLEEEEKKKQEEEMKLQQEEAAAKLKEKEEAHQLHQEAWERHQARKELRSKNQNASESRPEENFFSRLDSSLKKNTAFVKKLKTITEQQRDSLSHDFNGLNLSKYIAEAVASIVEAKLKISDVNCAVHLCSLFHQRYADFAPSLLQVWKKHFEARKEEKTPNITKLRTDLRFIAELTIVGIFTDKEGLSLIYEQLKSIINADRETHTHVSVVISFCRHCGDDIAGLVPRKVKSAADKFSLSFPPSEIISAEKQQPFQNLLKEYFTSLTKHLKRDHRELQNIERQNRHRILFETELKETKENKDISVTEDLELELENLDINDETLDLDCGEEAEDLTKKLLDEQGKKQGADSTGAENSDGKQAARKQEDEETSTGSHLKLIVDAFLQQLPNCVNRDLIDKAAMDFCMNMNTKANRRKLVRALFIVPRQRLDLLPFYARLVGTLHPCMSDVAEDLCSMLKGDFRFHVRKKDQINIETKNKTVRFIGELTKFKMFSKSDTLHCLKMLLSDFSHHHIEMACTLLETCGRFLFRSPDSHLRTSVLLEQMMRKKQAMHLDARYVTMVENAYYYCNPPLAEKTVKKKRPPLQEYIRKLLYKDLSKVTTEKVLRQMRKLPWHDHEVKDYVICCMINIWNVKYNSIHCVANLLAGLVLYQEDVGIHVVDGVLEDIRLGMEVNQPKFNQRRISSAKFLGELYNYRMVESAVIFRTLYSFTLFGVNSDGTPSLLDPPEHLFRIRLVCTILDTCGQYFDRGSSKRKLDCFLVYFQRYVWWKKSLDVWTKDHPFPIDIDYMISDTLELLRPKIKLCNSLEESMRQVQELEREFLIKLGLMNDKDSKDSMTEGENLEEDEDEEEGGVEIEEQSGNESEINEPEEEEGSENDDDEGEEEEEENTDYLTDSNKENETDEENTEVMIKGGGLKRVPCAEDEDFIQALDKMMLENLQQRSGESVKVHQLDVAIPLHLKSQLKKGPPLGGGEGESESGDTMPFVMLTRKGNKQQFKILNVPMSSQLAANHWNQQQAEQEERMRMKKLTLDINERQEQEDYQEMMQSLAQRPAPANTNRERRPRYQHPKGAPNADLIFKTGGRRR
ncbi:PREDICTED: regulator of nonsense transcripts 2 [Thamnophis sirtalis]|uniref:Regulator of nonsense transcripts 2 n=1 Tax=Thamnophis sirtalis TaxID=35019 RepID=A0A6I9YZ81_9SAUR|nr:PREDICTED: regulator of nonsense transcripts 2 [Thamnophis sirtalis]